MTARLRLATLCAVAVSWVAAPLAAQDPSIDFGKDDNEYARDGQCDDPRFTGPGMTNVMLTDDIGRDASDCRAAFAAGHVTMNPLFARPANNGAIIFGDDTSTFANDGDCDDIRFVGPKSAEDIFLFEHVGHDASDCRAGFNSGELRWQGHLADPERGQTYEEITGGT